MLPVGPGQTSNGESPPPKHLTLFSILNGFRELSFIIFLHIFSSLEYREMRLAQLYACNMMYLYILRLG